MKYLLMILFICDIYNMIKISNIKPEFKSRYSKNRIPTKGNV